MTIGSLQEYSLLVPSAEKIEGELEIQASSREGVYHVSLSDQTCDCPDFTKMQRSEYPRNHLGRWCKHLTIEMRRTGELCETDPWINAMIGNAIGCLAKAYWLPVKSAPDVVVVLEAESEWLSIFARSKQRSEKIAEASGPIERFGWSTGKRDWSYGLGPPGAGEVKKAFLTTTPSDLEDLLHEPNEPTQGMSKKGFWARLFSR